MSFQRLIVQESATTKIAQYFVNFIRFLTSIIWLLSIPLCRYEIRKRQPNVFIKLNIFYASFERIYFFLK